MFRLLGIFFLCLALCCGFNAYEFRDFQGRDFRFPVLEGWGEWDTKPDHFSENLSYVRRWKFGNTVAAILLYGPDDSRASESERYPRHFLKSAETRIVVVNEDHIGTLVDGSLPFTLSAIHTTLALLFLTAGVWLLWRDRKRRLKAAVAS